MRSTALPLLLAVPFALSVSALACDASVAEREGRGGSSSSIINGSASSSADDDAVALLWMGNSFCTGTLIAPNLLLTARHCVSEPGAGQAECEPFGADKAPSSMTVSLGEHPSSRSPVASGTRLFVEGKSTICGQDIALVLLDRDVPNVKPKQVRLTAPAAGELVTAIGYGQDENEATTGRRMRGNIAIEAVGPASRTATANGQSAGVQVPANDFMTGESVCHGDSGGPLFDAKGLVLGTTSRGTALGCVGAPAIFSSTAAHVPLIMTALAAAGHPLAPTGADAGTDAAAPDAAAGDGGRAEPTSTGNEPGAESSGDAGDGGAEKKSKKTKEDSDEDDDDADEDDKPKTGSKSRSSADPSYYATPAAVSSGCSESPRSPGSGVAMTVLALAVALSAGRRRSRRAPR